MMLSSSSTLASPWTGPVIATLCVATFALMVSLFALGWQIVSWRRSGAQLRVRTTEGFVGVPPEGRWIIGIEISNTGRLATEISQVGFEMARAESRIQIIDFEDALGMRIALPRTVAPGSVTSVLYAVDRMVVTLANEDVTGAGARPYADTAHGRTRGPRINLGEKVHRLSSFD